MIKTLRIFFCCNRNMDLLISNQLSELIFYFKKWSNRKSAYYGHYGHFQFDPSPNQKGPPLWWKIVIFLPNFAVDSSKEGFWCFDHNSKNQNLFWWTVLGKKRLNCQGVHKNVDLFFMIFFSKVGHQTRPVYYSLDPVDNRSMWTHHEDVQLQKKSGKLIKGSKKNVDPPHSKV